MGSKVTRELVTAATVASGFLAGANLDRNAVQMPAWGRLGAEAWLAYSRRADLSPNGRALYPAEGIGTAALTTAAAVSVVRDPSARRAALPILAAAACGVGGLLATLGAAPALLRVRAEDDPVAVRRAFEQFRFWGAVRGLGQVLSFVGSVWALSRLCGTGAEGEGQEGGWSI